MKYIYTPLVVACALLGASTISAFQESHRQRQEREMYAPRLSPATSIGQQQWNTMQIHQATAATRPANTNTNTNNTPQTKK